MNQYIIKIDNQFYSGSLYDSIFLGLCQGYAIKIKGEKELLEHVTFITDLKLKGRLKFKALTYEEIEG